jgi:acetate kinase
MQILVFNIGSSSLKYKLFSLNKEKKIKEERKGEFNRLIENKKSTHLEAIKKVIREIKNLTQIIAIGHRVVHGGNDFLGPTIINQNNLKILEKYNDLAPLHNPYNLIGIKSCLTYFGSIPNIAVFDTAFFKDLPLKAKIYPIPFKFYKDYGMERYGFHGISHQYALQIASKILKKPLEKLKLITCHLGSGCSITAIKNGKPIDTSMGFTPLEGLMMLTRCGDLDPGLILEIQKKLVFEKKDSKLIEETEKILNHESGIYGISGISDYLELLKNIKRNPRARLAFEIFIYRIQKYISAFYGILNDIDALVFTGKIGAGKPLTRKAICKDLKFLSRKKILVVKPDEELAIAKECLRILKL